IPEGTLSSRLAHARKVLADRLTRRGITVSVTALAAVLGSDAVTAIPHSLMNTTILAAARFVPGGVVPPGISPAVSSLTEEVLKTMFAARLKLLFALGLLACTLIGGGALAQQLRPVQNESADSPPAEIRSGDDAKPKPPEEKKDEKKVGAKGI